VKERGILFSAPMVRALLAGTKTQTRRIVKLKSPDGEVYIDPGGSIFGPGPYVKNYPPGYPSCSEPMHRRIRCPYGYPGDRLWVRETWNKFDAHPVEGDGIDPRRFGARAPLPGCEGDREIEWRAVYRADGEIVHLRYGAARWKPGIHMPRWASRITLEVTGVRVERLHDITEDGARAEGVAFGEMQDAIVNGEPGRVAFFSARDAFAYLWAGSNGSESWKANPWVWVVEFKRIEVSP